MRAYTLFSAAPVLAAVALATACTTTDPHALTYSSTTPPEPPPGVVIEPARPSVLSQPAPPPSQTGVVVQPSGVPAAQSVQTVQADQIEARDVSARTIYANKIEASTIRGTIPKLERVSFDSRRGDLAVPSVVAGTIYADRIVATTVTANHIYVRDLERR